MSHSGLGDEQKEHVARTRAQRLDHADLLRPFEHRRVHRVGDAQAGEQQRDDGQSEERQAKLLELVETVNRAKALPEIYEAAVTAICKCVGTSRASILLYDEDNLMRFKYACDSEHQ